MLPSLREVAINQIARLRPLKNALRRFTDPRRGVDDAQLQLLYSRALRRMNPRIEMIGRERLRDASVLEIGSGRDCYLATLLTVCGARRVTNIEVDRYGYAWKSLETAPPSVDVRFRSATDTGLSCNSVDVSFSIAVLEHIKRDEVPAVARELYRVTAPGGVGFHRVDLVDHYTRKTDPFRMHRYAEWAWNAMYSHRASYSNRLRIHDLERIFSEAGFFVVCRDVVGEPPTECLLVLRKPEDSLTSTASA